MQYRLWQLVTALVQRLPLRFSYAAAAAIGTVAFYLWPGGRRRMLRNFHRVLPDAGGSELRRVARRSLVNYCRYLVDFVRFPSFAPSDLHRLVHGEQSFAALDAALAQGRGVIIVCMHFGNWDLGAAAAAARGHDLTVVAETFADPRLDTMIVRARERLGMKVVKMEKAAPSLLRALKRNGLLALLIDRPTPGDGVRVQFFGRELEVPAGPARLALRSGAAVLPAAFLRMQPNSPDVEALTDPSIRLCASGDAATDTRAFTQAIMESHERFIRAHPEQWYMFRDMWPRNSRNASIGT